MLKTTGAASRPRYVRRAAQRVRRRFIKGGPAPGSSRDSMSAKKASAGGASSSTGGRGGGLLGGGGLRRVASPPGGGRRGGPRDGASGAAPVGLWGGPRDAASGAAPGGGLWGGPRGLASGAPPRGAGETCIVSPNSCCTARVWQGTRLWAACPECAYGQPSQACFGFAGVQLSPTAPPRPAAAACVALGAILALTHGTLEPIEMHQGLFFRRVLCPP